MSAIVAEAAGHACPGCAQRMRRRTFERRPHGIVDIDLCFDCHAMWFDQYESTALAPVGIVELFRLIHERGTEAARPVAERSKCPICQARLAFTQDIQRTNRFSYHRCPAGHGRFTTFFQFLREKHFVRSLTPVEIARLRVTMKQVRCSSCGAAVDIERDASCGFCRTPLAILDADAVKRTLAELDEAERRRHVVDPQGIIDGILAGKAAERRLERYERGAPASAYDLIHEALHQLMSD